MTEMRRGQSAIEFIAVYGWAILIFLISVSILFVSGVFSGPQTAASVCVLPGDLSCSSYALNLSGGLILDLANNKPNAISVTAIRCSDEANPAFNATDNLMTPVTIRTGEHAVVSAADHLCYMTANGAITVATGSLGTPYRGRIYIKYLDLESGITRIATGDVALKFENAGVYVGPQLAPYNGTGWAWFAGNYPFMLDSLTCDDTYCYCTWSNGGGNVTKVRKSDASVVWMSSPGYAPYSIYCDGTYCYVGEDGGWLMKVYQGNGSVIIPGVGIGPGAGSSNGIWCDGGTYCWTAHWDNSVGHISKTLASDYSTVWIKDIPSGYNDEWCDAVYCYGIRDNGNMSKLSKSDGSLAWNVNAHANTGEAISCDGTYCYGAHNGGYMSKVRMSDGAVMWPGGIQPSASTWMFSIWCDGQYCYGGHYGIMSKVDSATGAIVWGDGAQTVTTSVTDHIYDLWCDSTYCFGGTGSGYFIKVRKSDGAVIWGGKGTVWLNDHWANGIYCDGTYCYGAHEGGYLSKISEATADVVWSDDVQPATSQMNNVWCDDTYCYGGHADGKYSKTYKANGTIVGAGGFDASGVNGIYCESGYCYGAQANGNLTKLNMTDGTKSFSTRPRSAVAADLFCDSLACFVPYAGGYVYAVNKANGATLWSARPDTNDAKDVWCDGTYCYSVHLNGNIGKMWEGNGTVIWDVHKSINYNDFSAISCDSSYCWGETVYDFLKLNKTDGSTIAGATLPLPYSSEDMWCDGNYCYVVGAYGEVGRINKNTMNTGD